MTYELIVKGTGGGFEAVVTYSGMTNLPTDTEVERAKAAVIDSFTRFTESECETLAVCKRPVQESDHPGRMTDDNET